MNLKPLNDWILVKLLPIDKQLGSIIIPEGVDHRKAEVVATGPGLEYPNGAREPTGVVPGEKVLFNRAHGEHLQGKQMINKLGGDMLLLKPDDILLVYEGELEVS